MEGGGGNEGEREFDTFEIQQKKISDTIIIEQEKVKFFVYIHYDRFTIRFYNLQLDLQQKKIRIQNFHFSRKS